LSPDLHFVQAATGGLWSRLQALQFCISNLPALAASQNGFDKSSGITPCLTIIPTYF
jgi:hypothetical protein